MFRDEFCQLGAVKLNDTTIELHIIPVASEYYFNIHLDNGINLFLDARKNRSIYVHQRRMFKINLVEILKSQNPVLENKQDFIEIKTKFITIKQILVENQYVQYFSGIHYFEFDLEIQSSGPPKIITIKGNLSEITNKINILNAILNNNVNINTLDIGSFFTCFNPKTDLTFKESDASQSIIRWAGKLLGKMEFNICTGGAYYYSKENEYVRDVDIVIKGIRTVEPKFRMILLMFIFDTLKCSFNIWYKDRLRHKDDKCLDNDIICIRIVENEFVSHGKPSEVEGLKIDEERYFFSLRIGLSIKEYILTTFVKTISPIMLNSIAIRREQT